MSTLAVSGSVLTEWRVQHRSGIPAGTAIATLAWVVVVAVVPRSVAAGVVPWVLLLDVAALGFFTAPSLAVVDRGTGVTACHAVAGASATRALGRRLAMLVAWSVASATAVVVAAGVPRPGVVLVGVAATTALFALVSLAILGRDDTLVAWLPRVPLMAVPLLVPALLVATGLSTSPAWSVSPVTGAWHWLDGTPSWFALGWLLAWVAALAWGVARPGWVLAGAGAVDGRAPRPFPGWPAAARPGAGPWCHRARAIRSLARVDRRALAGDRLAAMLVAGVPVLAVLVRIGTGPVTDLVATRTGIDVTPHLPAAAALLLVVHTATMFGTVAGLLVLEDRDAGVLAVLGTAPGGVATMLTWRLGMAAAATAVMVVLGLVVAGVAPAAGAVGLVATALAAGVVAAVPAVLLATLARDRVAGVVVMKAIGLPLYAPVLWWWLGDVPAAWLLGAVPTAWPARALWATTPAGALGCLALAVVTSGAVVVLGGRRLARQVVATT